MILKNTAIIMVAFCLALAFTSVPAAAEGYGEGRKSTTGIDRTITKRNIYDLGHLTRGFIGTQQFAIDKKGNIYYAEAGFKSHDVAPTLISKVKPCRRGGSDDIESTMTMLYQGHPTSFNIEDGKDGKTYVWIPNFSSKDKNGHYWGAQVISRVPYCPGDTLRPTDPRIENFYFSQNKGDVNVSIDFEHDTFAACFHDMNYPGRTRRVKLFRLQEVLATPLTDVTLKPVKFGGDYTPDPEQTVTYTIKAHDLSGMKPYAEVGTHVRGRKKGDINFYAWQGFDVYKDKVYFVEGQVENDGKSVCMLTIYNPDDTVFEQCTEVEFAADRETLRKYKISESGEIESEGVKIWKGHLYLGFDSWDYKGVNGSRGNVFKFNLPSK